MKKIIIMVSLIASVLCIIIYKVVDAQPFGFSSSKTDIVTHHRILCSEYGRYVFGQISDSSKDQFMLDTYTGRLWRIAVTGDVGIHLTPVLYKIKEGVYNPLPPPIKERREGRKTRTHKR